MTELIYLLPGEWVVTKGPAQLTTVLGSCISVILFDEKTGVSGMNHFVLPSPQGAEPVGNHGKFGIYSTPNLINKLAELGCPAERTKAVVTGGAHIGSGQDVFKVGFENASLAMSQLSAARIDVIHIDVGGARGRHVRFNTEDCSYRIRKIDAERAAS